MLRRLGGYTTGLLVASAIFFVTGELVARALDIVDRLNGYSRHLYTRGPSADLPYLLRPGFEATLSGLPVRVNRLGFRGPEVDPTPRPGVYRILMLGDSVLYGTRFNEDERLSEVAAAELNGAGPGEYEVINAGVPGWDTVAEDRQLARVGVGLAPQAVVVVFSLNDYELPLRMSPVGVLSHGDPRLAPSGLLDHSEFVLLLRWMVAFREGTLWQQFHQRGGTAPATADDDPEPQKVADALDRVVERRHLQFYGAPDPERWNRVIGALREIRDLTSGRGIRLLVAILPEGYQVGTPEPDLTPQRLLTTTCRAEAISCLDLHSTFAAAGGRLFLDVQHPNARGHVLIGRAIAAALSLPARAPVASRRTTPMGL